MSIDAYTFLGRDFKPANENARVVPSTTVAESWYRQFKGNFPGAVAKAEDKVA